MWQRGCLNFDFSRSGFVSTNPEHRCVTTKNLSSQKSLGEKKRSSNCPVARSGNRLLHCFGKHLETRLQIFSEMYAQSATAAFGKNVEIPTCLRCFDNAEGILLAGHR